MNHKLAFDTQSSSAIAANLCERLEAIRLSRNISQAELAEQAGVSRSTMTRIARGESISLDSFIRVIKALGLTEHLANLLPDPDIRPLELLEHEGRHRQRASRQSVSRINEGEPWSWGDEEDA
jgi:transcriptional regulator with XRE-family HTH domain